MPYAVELPPKYYLQHFKELLQEVKTRFAPLLNESHREFIKDFSELAEEAQCLYVRLLNRKGIYFLKSSLQYQEIGLLKPALSALSSKCFVRTAELADKDEILDFLSRDELFKIISLQTTEFKKSWNKEKLKKLAAEYFQIPKDIVVQSRKEEIDYILFLFFGYVQENLTLYTLRDLGIRKVNGYQGPMKLKFKTKEEAEVHYFYSTLELESKLNHDFSTWPLPIHYESSLLRERLLCELASQHIKLDAPFEALKALKKCKNHPARERLCRLYWDMDHKSECESLLNEIQENPFNDEECLFAEDFLERKFQKKRLSLLTETLRNAFKITIDEGFFRHPEFGAIEWYKAQGKEAFIAENEIWNNLFILLFWSELFESDKASFQNQFDFTPFDLTGPSFYKNHAPEIEEKLNLLQDKERALDYLVSLNKDGYTDSVPLICSLIKCADPLALAIVLRTMAQDYENRSSGFPDLLVIDQGQPSFVEIKATGDSIRKKQLGQMSLLRRAGFPVEVVQVEYNANPEQSYVVVDIETTGVSLNYHRITEIGAVKIKNGEVIETYQTLLNPGQSIPKRIQELTGITNEMVKNAPTFSEIAEAFQAFTKDSIFVAHNVKFDYHFIQNEYGKIEQKFVRPFICTSAGMKKHFPGLGSYGLGNLTNHFSIPLTTHHRALCDATATAQLLILINEKRRQKLALEEVLS